MNQLLSRQFAVKGILTILSIIVVFHFLVLTRVIPFQIVWGGRLKSTSEMYTFESISIAINLLMLAIIASYAGLIKVPVNPRVLKGAIWAMFGLFVINSIGNLLSLNNLETIIFTPITILLSIFTYRMASS